MRKNRACWAVMALAAGGLYFFENNGGTRALLWALLLLPAGSALLLYLPRLRLRAELALPDTAARQTAAEGRVLLKNEGRGLPLRWSGVLLAENLLTGEQTVLRLRRTVSPGETAELPFLLSAGHTGKLRVSLREARAADWLGLFSRRCPAEAEGETRISPDAFPLTPVLAETGDFLTDSQRYSGRRPGYDPSETFRIREYVPGDPIRRIHWKLSEKTGKTLVRDFGLPVVNRVLLLLELTAPPGTAPVPGDLDAPLDLFRSLSEGLLAQEIPHTAGWYDRRADAFVSREIAAPEALEAALDALLETPSASGEISAAEAFGREHGDCAYAHVVLISAWPPLDGETLFHGNRVTALLAGDRGFSAAPPPELETETILPEALRTGTLRLVL